MGDDRSSALRAFFAEFVAATGHAKDPRIAQAFAAVRREDFAGPGPWSIYPMAGYIRTPTDDIAFLYQNTLVAIDPARGINIGEPSLHARCLDALHIRPGETVLHVGAGVGYYTAVLAHLVQAGGRVHALEIEPDLAKRAACNLKHLHSVEVTCRSGLDPDLPSADVIYVNAGLPGIPETWLRALRSGGRLLFPFQPGQGLGGMLLITKADAGKAWPARFISRARFIGCAGAEDEAAGKRLAEAIETGRGDDVRSLRFDTDIAPDTRCWLRGAGWWLSFAKPEESSSEGERSTDL